MAPAPDDTSSPGTATYSSDTLHVDDGTWDFSKNTFLLPNLVGLNFETMRINGKPAALLCLHRLAFRRQLTIFLLHF
jgi:hypothetical protein